MQSINDNDLNNKELDEKVANFIRPKLEEINKNIDVLINNAKFAELDVSNLQDVLNLNPAESQEEYNFVVDLQNCAKDLLQNQEEYLFLKKSNDEVMDYLDDQINQYRLELCAKKVFLYRELGHDVEADDLEEELREIAMAKRIKKKTLDKIFKGKGRVKADRKDLWSYGKTDQEIIKHLNEKHATMVQMKEFCILLESDSDKLVLQKEHDFKKSYQEHVMRNDEKNRPLTVADIWLASPDKRRFNEISFNPDPSRILPEKDYNLWKGFAFEPKEGDISVFKDFTREVICNGNEQYFNYIWGWIARMIQKPHEPGETAIVLKGKQGTGKNTFVETVGKLLGNHFSPLSSIEQLLGRFDFHHANAILLHANEAIWGGDRRMLGKLKTLITERHVTVEQKHRDPITLKNCRHMVFSSNEDWPVHIDRDDRRFFVLEISDKYKENTKYFKRIHDWADSGGLEALLDHFQHYDISNFNFRNIPQSVSAFQIKLDSACSTEVYVFEALKERRLRIHGNTNENFGCMGINDLAFWKEEIFDIPKHEVYQNYVYWCEDQKIRPETNRKLGRSIKKLLPSANTDKRVRDDESRVYSYEFPPLSKARKEFEESYKAIGVIPWDGKDLKVNQDKIVQLETT
jgi:hypothetical protein